MKKAILFTSAAVLLLGSIAFVSNASRTQYHEYLQQQIQDRDPNYRYYRYRPFSEGRMVQLERVLQDQSEKDAARSNLRFPANKRNLYSNKRQYNGDYNLRPMSNRIGRKNAKAAYRLTRKPMVKLALNTEAVPFATYANDTFSFQLPVSWAPEAEGSHTFVSEASNYEVTVKYFNPESCGRGSMSFFDCVNDISRTENNAKQSETNSIGAGKLNVTSRVQRMNRYSDTILNDQIQTRTITESFSAQIPWATEETYFNRFFVADVDGGVYMIETATEDGQQANYIGISKRIFDSFRIYPKGE